MCCAVCTMRMEPRQSTVAMVANEHYYAITEHGSIDHRTLPTQVKPVRTLFTYYTR